MAGGSQPKGAGGKPDDKNPMGGSKDDPMTGGGGANDPKNPMNAGGGLGGRSVKPDLPLDDPFTKQVWGHLPEKLRQQAMQSYREQFMPKYNELLKQYYSNIAEREKASPKK